MCRQRLGAPLCAWKTCLVLEMVRYDAVRAAGPGASATAPVSARDSGHRRTRPQLCAPIECTSKEPAGAAFHRKAQIQAGFLDWDHDGQPDEDEADDGFVLAPAPHGTMLNRSRCAPAHAVIVTISTLQFWL